MVRWFLRITLLHKIGWRKLISKIEDSEPIAHEEFKMALEKYDWKFNKEILPKPIMRLMMIFHLL